MKLTYLLASLSLAMALFLAITTLEPNNEGDTENTKEEYKEYCSGCHGAQLQHFKRLKSFKKSEEALVKIIAQGNEVIGMPGFREALSEEQIASLARYIRGFDYTQNHTQSSQASADVPYETVVDGMEIPWAFAFIGEGEMLICEKKGNLYRFVPQEGKIKVKGLPPVNAAGQGGLLEVKLHPDYAENGWIYIAYSYIDRKNSSLTNTAILRARLNKKKNSLYDKEEIYRGSPSVRTRHHYGTRIVFDSTHHIYFANGDRGKRDIFPQSLDNTNGKIHRLRDDGSIPRDNPFLKDAQAQASIFTYGHRNPQGLAIHPQTQALWEHEHGPRGGDEINIIQKGKNYGWPVISYGINYSGTRFTEITEMDGMEQPVHYYVPSIAPCGMTFLDSKVYPAWKGNLFIGSLRDRYLERLVLQDEQVIYQEKLLENLNSRVRDVRVGPDGYLYVALEGPGRIIKILK